MRPIGKHESIDRDAKTLINLARTGVYEWEHLAIAALGYMSPADVHFMAVREGLLDEEGNGPQ